MQWDNVSVWRSLKTFSGYKEPIFQPLGDRKWVNDLNLFFNRFDQSSAPPPSSPLCCNLHRLLLTYTAPPPFPQHSVHSHPAHPMHLLSSAQATSSTQHPCPNLSLPTIQVRKELRTIKVRKAAGPDGISSRPLKSCAVV